VTPVDVVGWLGALTATILGIPQAIRLLRTSDTRGVSLVAWQAILAINIGWTSHGIVLGQPAMIVPGASIALVDEAGHVRPMEQIETDTLKFAIEHYRGQMSQVARRLGIGRSTLYRKLKDLGLEEPVDAPEEV